MPGKESLSMEKVPVFHEVIAGQLYIANQIVKGETAQYHYFSLPKDFDYKPFCDDFGPMNLSSIVEFIELLEEQNEMHNSIKVVFLVQRGRRPLTNGVFLIGAYMTLMLSLRPEECLEHFQELRARLLEPFRDATFSPVDFGLEILDCWRALHSAMKRGWFRYPQNRNLWGMVDVDEYRRLENPLNGDLVQVVPGKFVAFTGPKNLGGVRYRDKDGLREFSPEYYADAFAYLNVKTVIRLNEAQYDSAPFASRGIAHFDLCFDDCTAPPQHIVTEFLRIVDSTKDGMVAVHCKAGLGRTGTLIALYLMRTHRFPARQAIAWLRIMRPGCVIGQQQHYLCCVEASAGAAAAPAGRDAPPPLRRSAPGRRRSLPDIPTVDLPGNLKAAWEEAGQGAAAGGANSPVALAAQVSAAIERRASLSASVSTDEYQRGSHVTPKAPLGRQLAGGSDLLMPRGKDSLTPAHRRDGGGLAGGSETLAANRDAVRQRGTLLSAPAAGPGSRDGKGTPPGSAAAAGVATHKGSRLQLPSLQPAAAPALPAAAAAGGGEVGRYASLSRLASSGAASFLHSFESFFFPSAHAAGGRAAGPAHAAGAAADGAREHVTAPLVHRGSAPACLGDAVGGVRPRRKSMASAGAAERTAARQHAPSAAETPSAHQSPAADALAPAVPASPRGGGAPVRARSLSPLSFKLAPGASIAAAAAAVASALFPHPARSRSRTPSPPPEQAGGLASLPPPSRTSSASGSSFTPSRTSSTSSDRGGLPGGQTLEGCAPRAQARACYLAALPASAAGGRVARGEPGAPAAAAAVPPREEGMPRRAAHANSVPRLLHA